MENRRTGDRLELSDCQRVLEITLLRLDSVGAGIAAIHVDAAIQQLKQNLQTIDSGLTEVADYDPDLICAFEVPRITH